MARLWTCGFESQSATLELGVNSGTIAGGVTPDISTTVKRRGTASLRSHPTTNQSYVEHQIDTGTVKRTLHRLYLRVATRPSVDTNVYAIGQAGYFPASLRLLTTGELVLRDSFSGTTLTGTSAVLDLDRWYRVELDYTDVAGTPASGVSAFKGYLDGALFADAMCANINGWSRVRMGINGVNATADIFIDDVAVNDTAGSVQNGLPGSGCVVHLLPNAAGDNNLFETAIGGTAGAANNYTRVAERTPDDSTSYNQTAATGTTTIDDFNLTSSADAGIGSADSITCVQVGGRVSSDALTAANLVYRLKSQAAGTVAESASFPVNNTGSAGAWSAHRGQSPRPYQLTSYTDPQDGSAWTAAKLDSAQIGYRSSVSQTTIRRVTAVWALVEFVPRFALGVASEPTTAHALGYAQSAFPVKTLVDDFDDNTVDTGLWPNSFGTYSETGGKAHVAVNTGYNAYSSAKAYRLQNSQLTFQIMPPTIPDGATEAWAQVLIKSNVEGTDLGFEVGIGSGNTVCFNRTGYFDAEAAYLTYNATAHAWMRIRESGGQVFFDTAPDGHTWTNRRTITSPAWVADGDLEVQMIAHRADGTDNFVDYDNINVLPPYLTSISFATSTNFGRALAMRKTRSIGFATASQTAHAFTVTKRRSIGLASTTTTARGVTRSKSKGLGAAASGVSAMALKALRLIPIGSGSVANSGHGLDPNKLRTLGNPARTADQASSQTARKRAPVGSAAQAVTGLAVRALRIIGTGLASQASSAHVVSPAKSGGVAPAASQQSANPVSVRKSLVIGAAATETTTEALRAYRRYSVAPGGSQATGWPVVALSGASLEPATATEQAHELGHRRSATLSDAATTTSGHAVTASKHDPRSTPAEAVDSAHALVPRKLRNLGRALQADAARPPAGSVKLLQVGVATSTHLGSGTEVTKRSYLGPAQSTHTATAIDPNKLGRLDAADTATAAHAVTWKRRTSLGLAGLADTGRALDVDKTRHLVNGAVATTTAGVAVRKTRSVDRGITLVSGLDVRASKRVILGVASETSETHEIELAVLNRLLGNASEFYYAHTLGVVKQRPADSLTPGITEPGLIPGTTGPGLTASTSGPNLTAYTTSGGS
ncbi:minor tail protein [Streptomyces phage Hiyaa]|uniref:Minor tail protein n=1 Tax=Streptomyces phage Hiyaa TaxID=2499072 RepID=A0A3S9U8S9_9CAUD|nr:minor tail protein [Streptomyces phage Hiyaa]AZS06653.1 minor tail protein [Streptomyces phage Hiyaa]